MTGTFRCLYCDLDKPDSEASLEHAVPQFMGGDSSPQQFHLRNVCTTCNNRLGLFVDASYAKSWFVTNMLAEAARLLCTDASDPGLPLRYIGHATLANLNVPDDEVAEYWLGPSGESIVWIRPHDDRMDSYSGGNPIDTKTKPSVAYFFPTSADAVRYELGFQSFRRAFKKRKVRKILSAEIRDSSGATVLPSLCGYDVPNPIDTTNLSAISSAIAAGNIPARLSINTRFDLRFICKIALGVGYSLFGDDFLKSETAPELRKGLWPKKEEPIPAVRGMSTLPFDRPQLGSIVGYPSAVAIMVMKIKDHWSLTVSIDQKLPFVINLGPATLTSSYVNSDEGYTLLLFPYLDKSIELTTAGLLAHRHGSLKHPELNRIDIRLRGAASFDAQLVSLALPMGAQEVGSQPAQ